MNHTSSQPSPTHPSYPEGETANALQSHGIVTRSISIPSSVSFVRRLEVNRERNSSSASAIVFKKSHNWTVEKDSNGRGRGRNGRESWDWRGGMEEDEEHREGWRMGMRKKRKRNRREVGEGKGKKASEEGGRKRKCIIGRSREKERIKNKIKDTKHIKRTEKEKRRDR